MTSKHVIWLAGAAILTIINLSTVALNFSTKATASVAGMDRRDLYRDRDFRRAVEDVVENCAVNDGQISC